MAIDILFFGSLVDATTVSNLTVVDLSDTNALRFYLETRYPALKTDKYFIAVNQQMIEGNTVLTTGDTVALMPPFSGG